jgi:hypothetical protein
MHIFANFNSNDDLNSTGDMVALVCLFAAFLLTITMSIYLSLSIERRTTCHKIVYAGRCICFIIAYAIMFYGFNSFRQLQKWMGDSNWFVGEDGEVDDGEFSVESFGQVIPLVLLALPVLAVVEQFSSEFFFFSLFLFYDGQSLKSTADAFIFFRQVVSEEGRRGVVSSLRFA